LFTLLQESGPEQEEALRGLPGAAAPGVEKRCGPPPDAHWLLADRAGRAVARCALWWSATPAHEGHRLGLIGHYAAVEGEAGPRLLELACGRLTGQGCTLAVGPMDGSTWQRYRLVTERGTEPTFFLEPDNPDDWPGHFRAAGFAPLAHYYSALNADLAQADPRLPEWARCADARGIALRPLDLGRFGEELRALAALSLESFSRNFLFTPVGLDDIVAQYQAVRRYVRGELVLVAEQDGRVVGYIFALPDLLQARRGLAIDTIVIKTIAVHPDLEGSGLGSLLASRCHEAARGLGYTRAIHALMHETSRSRSISNHSARTVRRYTLFARPLGRLP
jgi:GNAT superfamily N-acetyltransferase